MSIKAYAHRLQELISRQMLERYCDSLVLVVGLMGQRCGSPTGTHELGTEQKSEWVLISGETHHLLAKICAHSDRVAAALACPNADDFIHRQHKHLLVANPPRTGGFRDDATTARGACLTSGQ